MEAVLDALPFDEIHALEYGGGKYSTQLLIWRCASVVTVERNPEWRKMLWDEHATCDKWTLKEDIESPEGFNLVFVDDVIDKRVGVANAAFSAGIPVVIIHDTEQNCYKYWNLAPGPSYVRYDYAANYSIHKRTSVFATWDVAPSLDAIKPDRHTRLT